MRNFAHLALAVAAVLTCALAPAPSLAQERPPLLQVASGPDGKPTSLALSRLALSVSVTGELAETTTTLTYCNPFNRQLEGTLHVPLPTDATVSGYGLDIDGVLVEGVIVEKEKAQVVFEKEVRKGVDPGLVEWTRGNNFKTRVYPIPAKGCRTIAVKFLSSLRREGEVARYTLPLHYAEVVDEVSLTVEVAQGGARPRLTWPGPALQLGDKGGVFFGSSQAKKQKLVGVLSVELADSGKTRVAVEESSGASEAHFFISDASFAAATPAVTGATHAPKRLTLFWDTSSSRGKQAHDRELALVQAYFGRFPGARIAVDLVTFSNTADKPRRFEIFNGDSTVLRKALASLEYDGGTQLGALPQPASDSDVALLFSDGLSTFGEASPKPLAMPLFAFSQDLVLNAGYLRWLSQRSGGEFTDLNAVKPEVAAGRIGGARLAVLSIKGEGGQLRDVYPRPGQPIDGALTITGVLGSPTATVVLEVGLAGKVTERRTYTLSRQNPARTTLIARAWAQRRVADLAVFPEQNHRALLDLGQRWGLVTPATSLIVLERLDQYVEHDIRPPASLAAMRKEWDGIMASRAQSEKEDARGKLERIVGLWQERIAWYERKFTYPPNFRFGEESPKKSARNGRGGGHAESGAAMEDREMMAPAPSSAPAPAAEASKDEAPSAKAKEDDAAADDAAANASITLAAWTPDTPYLRALDAASVAQRSKIYFEQKAQYGNAPAFFLDCADFFARKGDHSTALRVLSNIAELELDNAALIRVLAHRLRQLKELDLAIIAFDEVLRLRPEEPQSYRDLALTLADRGDYARAMDLLKKVVLNTWDRFNEIEVIALLELNHIIPKAKAKGIPLPDLDPRLIRHMELDVRISLTWDADLTDIDLWVDEPSAERAYYGHNLTTIGGLVSRDFTQGYGPEEYVLKRAMRGTYKVQTNFYGSSAQSLIGAVTLQLDLFTNYGRPNEKRQSITLRLTENKETFTVGELKF